MIDQILQNTQDKIEIDIYYNNVLTNPTSIVITSIRDPNGNVILTNQTPTAGATTGRYEYTLGTAYTATLGIYTAIWQFVINNTTYQHTQEFEVVSSLRSGYIVPEEVRDITVYDKITVSSPSDAVLQKYIDLSTDIMDAYFGDSINYAQYTEKIPCVLDKNHNGVHIQLKHKPIVSLTSVQLMQGPTNTLDLDVDYIRINYNAGYLEYFEDISVPTLRICIFDPTKTHIIPVATVVYTAGYTTVPDRVKRAAVIIVEELYKETQGEQKQLTRLAMPDGYSETYKTDNASIEAMKELGINTDKALMIVKLLRPYVQSFRRAGFAGPLG